MKLKIATFSLCLIVASLIADDALAHGRGHWGHRHGGVRWGVTIGVPLGWHYPPPYWYGYSPPVVVHTPPPVYIERGAPPETEEDAYYWYHCSRPEGYHPYIKECPGGWQKVVPTPPK